MILVEGISLKICLSQKHFDDLVNKVKIEEKYAAQWLQECIVGQIQKLELDTERMVETNSLDLMHNTSIIYHPESILEMQFATLLMCSFFHRHWTEKFGYD